MVDNRMKYKGFIAEINYSGHDECFHGKVLHISDSLSFEGNTIDELKGNFKEVIDEYLSFCVDVNKEMKTSEDCLSTIILNISLKLKKDLQNISKQYNISLNNTIEQILRHKTEEFKNEKKKSK